MGGFGDSSLHGRYPIVCESGTFTGFAREAIDFDGEGGLSGALRLIDAELEDPMKVRVIIATGVVGSYAVEDDGFVDVSLTHEADGFER